MDAMAKPDLERLYFFMQFKMLYGSENRRTLKRLAICSRQVGDPADDVPREGIPRNAEAYNTPKILLVGEDTLEVRYRPDQATFAEKVTFDSDGKPTIEAALMQTACQKRLSEMYNYRVFV
jgi:hypothetical protein